MHIKSILRQPLTLPNETRSNNNKSDSTECQFQTKSGYSYSSKELDDFINSIIGPNSPPAEEIKKYIKFNIEFVEIPSLKANFEINQNQSSIRDQICHLFINYNELKRSYDNEITEFNNRINEFIIKEDKQLKNIIENHQIEQIKFNQKWLNPEFINSFNKTPSSEDQEKITKSPEVNNDTTKARNDEIQKLKEIELKDLISSQKDQINKFNENKYKYIEYLKMENQKCMKRIACSLNQVKSKGKFLVSSRNFLIEIESQKISNIKQSLLNFEVETLNNQKIKSTTNLQTYKCQTIENKATQKKTKVPRTKSQLTYFKNYSSTLNLEMSNVFKNNNNIVSTEKRCYKSVAKPTLPKLNQGILSQKKNVFTIKQPSIKKPDLLLSVNNKNLNVLNSAVKKPQPLKSSAPFQIKKLGDLKEVEQKTPENTNNKVDEIHQDVNKQSKNEKIQWVENDYQYHYNKKFRDNMFFIDYKKYKFSKKNPFTDNSNKKKVVYIK